MRTMLKSKIHRATVTDANLQYQGSITIDPVLLEAADIHEYEMVHVLNINNGARFETYAIAGRRGEGEICINGAAARLAAKGDLVIIITYEGLTEDELLGYEPTMVYVNDYNRITRVGHKVEQVVV